MTDLLSLYDPARDVDVDRKALRARVDQVLGLETVLKAPLARKKRGAWVALAAGFAVVLTLFLPLLLVNDRTELDVAAEAFGRLPGVESVIIDTPDHGGGVRTMAVDGDTIWVMNGLAHRLNKIDARTNDVVASYPIDGYVEGVVIGGGYLWLRSYDNDGEILRFDPSTGLVDLTISFPSLVGPMAWWDGHLLVSDGMEVSQIDPDGGSTPFGPGRIGVEAEGRLWLVLEEETGTFIVSSDGHRARFDGIIEGEIPWDIVEAGGYLWVKDSTRKLYRIDLDGAESIPVPLGSFPHGVVEHDGFVWVSDYRDHTLSRIDIDTAAVVSVTPLGGRPGAMLSTHGSLFVSLYQPGVLLRFDTTKEMATVGEIVVNDITDGFHLICTGGRDGPTILLDGPDWLGPGMWSIVQSELSRSSRVCAHGAATPEDADSVENDNDRMLRALEANGIEGPYVLVSVLEGVYSTAALASQLDDVVGLVLIDPIPPGFVEWFEENLPDNANFEGFPPAVDRIVEGNFGDIPLIVINHDTRLTFGFSEAAEAFGSAENAEELNRLWSDGIDFYSSLSTESTVITAEGTHAGGAIWIRPSLVVDSVNGLIARVAAG